MQPFYLGNQEEGVGVGTSILTVMAEDIDQTASNNSFIEYSLISGHTDYFTIDSETGVIANAEILVRVLT